MHLNVNFTLNHEIGAGRSTEWDVEVVRTDGGHEVRNARWSAPLRSYDVSGYTCANDNADFVAIRNLWEMSEGGSNSFNLWDWVDEEYVRVRFEGPLQISAPTPSLRKIDTLSLVEVRE